MFIKETKNKVEETFKTDSVTLSHLRRPRTKVFGNLVLRGWRTCELSLPRGRITIIFGSPASFGAWNSWKEDRKMDLIPVQEEPLDLTLRKKSDEQNDGCGEVVMTSVVSPEKKVVKEKPEQPEYGEGGLLESLLHFLKTEPESAEDSDQRFEPTPVDCDSTGADSKAWLFAGKRKRPRVPHMEELLKTLPFKKRICLMMKYSPQDLPFMNQDDSP